MRFLHKAPYKCLLLLLLLLLLAQRASCCEVLAPCARYVPKTFKKMSQAELGVKIVTCSNPVRNIGARRTSSQSVHCRVYIAECTLALRLTVIHIGISFYARLCT